MVALSIHLCGVVTESASVCFDNGYVCVCDNQHYIDMHINSTKKNAEQKVPPRVLPKKQPSTNNHIDTYMTPATPNFNVVLGSAEHHEQKWLFFLKAAKHIIQSTTLNWGTGATKRLWSSTS